MTLRVCDGADLRIVHCAMELESLVSRQPLSTTVAGGDQQIHRGMKLDHISRVVEKIVSNCLGDGAHPPSVESLVRLRTAYCCYLSSEKPTCLIESRKINKFDSLVFEKISDPLQVVRLIIGRDAKTLRTCELRALEDALWSIAVERAWLESCIYHCVFSYLGEYGLARLVEAGGALKLNDCDSSISFDWGKINLQSPEAIGIAGRLERACLDGDGQREWAAVYRDIEYLNEESEKVLSFVALDILTDALFSISDYQLKLLRVDVDNQPECDCKKCCEEWRARQKSSMRGASSTSVKKAILELDSMSFDGAQVETRAKKGEAYNAEASTAIALRGICKIELLLDAQRDRISEINCLYKEGYRVYLSALQHDVRFLPKEPPNLLVACLPEPEEFSVKNLPIRGVIAAKTLRVIFEKEMLFSLLANGEQSLAGLLVRKYPDLDEEKAKAICEGISAEKVMRCAYRAHGGISHEDRKGKEVSDGSSPDPIVKGAVKKKKPQKKSPAVKDVARKEKSDCAGNEVTTTQRFSPEKKENSIQDSLSSRNDVLEGVSDGLEQLQISEHTEASAAVENASGEKIGSRKEKLSSSRRPPSPIEHTIQESVAQVRPPVTRPESRRGKESASRLSPPSVEKTVQVQVVPAFRPNCKTVVGNSSEIEKALELPHLKIHWHVGRRMFKRNNTEMQAVFADLDLFHHSYPVFIASLIRENTPPQPVFSDRRKQNDLRYQCVGNIFNSRAGERSVGIMTEAFFSEDNIDGHQGDLFHHCFVTKSSEACIAQFRNRGFLDVWNKELSQSQKPRKFKHVQHESRIFRVCVKKFTVTIEDCREEVVYTLGFPYGVRSYT